MFVTLIELCGLKVDNLWCSMEPIENDAIVNASSTEVAVADASVEDHSCFAFIARYTLKTMRLKSDKWGKMMAIEEYRV